MNQNVDLIVIGGGLVGLSTAYNFLLEHPGSSVLVLEKEAQVCAHQSGRNSGVLHAGIYYKPGSLKAQNCFAGKVMLEEFCTEHGIPWRKCGKVIVAVDEKDKAALPKLLERGLANGVSCRAISKEELKELEPAANGIAGIHVLETGVVDFPKVGTTLKTLIEKLGGRLVLGAKVQGIVTTEPNVKVLTSNGDFSARSLINCAGLYSDKIFELSGETSPVRIIPFRGEYYILKESAAGLCKNLIYPVPDPELPFLGVHFTRSIHGEVDCGPNAVLAFAREGYTLTDINLSDLFDSLSYVGFYRLVAKHWRHAIREGAQSIIKSLFVHAAQRLVPEIKASDLVPAAAGVRAQAVGRDGKNIDDFYIVERPKCIHVLNAPSPAATSCLSIGKNLASKLS